eukprot:14519_1
MATIVLNSLLLVVLQIIYTIGATNNGYPNKICAFGDVQEDYSSRDPRLMMGTYTLLNTTAVVNLDVSTVNITFPIYHHTYPVNTTSDTQYLFKANGIGWALSDSLPTTSATANVHMTCFQDNLFDCHDLKWYWGFNEYEFPVTTFRITSSACSPYFCIKGTVIHMASSTISFDGEYNRSVDATAGNYKWSNIDAGLEWIYRDIGSSQNWVLRDSSTNDRVACAPGYVDSPLFCNVFVYVESTLNPLLSSNRFGHSAVDGGNDTFKMGVCGDTNAPTAEPTAGPITASPTKPTFGPITPVTCTYDAQSLDIGDTRTIQCAFGYSGTNDTFVCSSTGQMALIQGCHSISFSDEFIDLQSEQWAVYDPSGVSLDVSYDERQLRFLPEDSAFVNVIQSTQSIAYPARVRVVVRKQLDECNLWFIAMGKEYGPWMPQSTRVSWYCDARFPSGGPRMLYLYNSTFRLYDGTCWQDLTADAMEVVYTVLGKKAKVITNQSDCAPLGIPPWGVQMNDIGENGWNEDAYLWFGSYIDDTYNSDTTNQSIVGRFESVQYTHFFTDFAGRLDVWNDVDTVQAVMSAGDRLRSNSKLYQFQIPFTVRLGIKKPFAQFVSLGGSEYVDETTSNVVQIVWNEKRKMVFAYTGGSIRYEMNCTWETTETVFDVIIVVDSTNVMVMNALCDSLLVAEHDLAVNQTVITLGMVDNGDFDDNEITEFTYIEVYQLPSSYVGIIADQEELSNVIDIATLPPIQTTSAPETTEELEGTVDVAESKAYVKQCLFAFIISIFVMNL